MVKVLGCGLMAVALGGCASVPTNGGVEHLLRDELFPAVAEPIRRDEIFAVSDAMRTYLNHEISVHVAKKGAARALYEALLDQLRLEYDSEVTRTAAQAFEARSGNCLSLVILTAALAKQLDIAIDYQSVRGHDSWSRNAGMAVRAGHVNVVLGPLRPGAWAAAGRDSPMTVDFLPPGEAVMHATRSVPEATVVAMYLNNRAAELIVRGDPGQAYWWAREAILSSPSFLSPFITLGVIYLRQGNLAEAEQAIRHVIAREPLNPQALTNLAILLAAGGRQAEADAVRVQLAAIEPYPPFHFYDLGMDALEHGDQRMALAWFKRELERMPYDDEVHFGMALASLRMGQSASARRHLALAMQNSTTHDRHDLYAAKLEHLKLSQRR